MMIATPARIRELLLQTHPTYTPGEAAAAIGTSVEDVER
jgi:hypothetical protein